MICPWKAWGVVRHYYFRCKGRGGSMEDFKVSTRKLKSDAEAASGRLTSRQLG